MRTQNLAREPKLCALSGKFLKYLRPKSESPENAGKLIDEGLSVARLNFSHGDHEEHRIQMVGVQEAMKSRPNAHVSILLDTKGPEIRTGNNKDGKSIELKKGQLLEISKIFIMKPPTTLIPAITRGYLVLTLAFPSLQQSVRRS